MIESTSGLVTEAAGNPDTLWLALLLGVVEGLTEFIPVSSTGHLILLIDILGFQGPEGRVFEIVIQLGAIAAVIWLYRQRFANLALNWHGDAATRRFGINIALAVIPSVVVGVLAHGFIKEVLFSPWVVSAMLILGGFAILAIERLRPATRYWEVDSFTPGLALRIGLCQVVAMIPGVSRSGATIMGALLLGAGRRAATEFSFFLAVPTMLGATVYDLYQNRDTLDAAGGLVIVIGFASAFIASLIVVRWVVEFVSRHGFVPFAWYRIAVGVGMLALLSLR